MNARMDTELFLLVAGMANRHELITGATGTGYSETIVTLKLAGLWLNGNRSASCRLNCSWP